MSGATVQINQQILGRRMAQLDVNHTKLMQMTATPKASYWRSINGTPSMQVACAIHLALGIPLNALLIVTPGKDTK